MQRCPYDDLWKYHFGIGLWIRNELLDGSPLLDWFYSKGIYSKDEMSAWVVRLYYLHIHVKL